MTDMLKVIEPKSDQINAEDLIGRDMTITITAVKVSPGTEQPVAMKFEGSDKLFRPCKTVSRIIVAAWGPDTSVYAGRSLTLYRDPTVKWAGMAVGGIRVKAISHIDAPLKLALAESKQNRKITVVQPLKLEAPQQQQRQTPEQWLDAHMAEIAATPVLDALASLQLRSAKPLAKLAENHPELHERAVAAMAERHEQLSNPAAAEKRDDADMGDGFASDPFNEEN
jgi:hypothetical protein